MKKLTGLTAGALIFITGLGVAAAQQEMGPPKVLVIEREYLKPGKGGPTHERSESAFVRAMTAAKWPTHYVGLDSMSGQPRSIFLIGYPSFAAWEKDNQAMEKNATLRGAVDRAIMADGELLSSFEQSVFTLSEEGSLRAGTADVPRSRYFEITTFRVKPGHRQEWQELVKLYKEGYDKIPSAKWALFESVYGADNGGLYLVFNPMKSLAEVEEAYADEKKFAEAMGADRMKRLGELSAECIASQQTNLFGFNPKMSYPADAWVKEDPAFWKPKMSAPVAPTQ